MNYLTGKEVFETFRDQCNLEDNYSFLAEDLEQLAQKMIEAAAPKIIAAERERCVTFVRSLNTQVAQALEDFKGDV
jgi:hypothetical protein